MLAAVWLRAGEVEPDTGVHPPLVLFTTLPLYWGEAGDVGAMLSPGRTRHWARSALEQRWVLVPVDTLEAAALRGRTRLLMAQPRPLAPQENVALDEWVATGGRLLLFADPLLTADSGFAIGDRRRALDTVLLSPILARWGLALTFDEGQPPGVHPVAVRPRLNVPVDLPGRLVLRDGGRGDAGCRVEAQGLLARCAIGRGAVIVVADAALFEADLEEDRRAFTALAEDTFCARPREITGRFFESWGSSAESQLKC